MSNDAFRAALISGEVEVIRGLWRQMAPHLPQPETRDDAWACFHLARTIARSVPDHLRFYSHRWLTDRGLPSRLPDPLRPRAERMYPRKVDAVGVAVRSQFPEVRVAIEGAMSDAAADCYANGDRDPLIVKPRMMAARTRERRGLMLPRGDGATP